MKTPAKLRPSSGRGRRGMILVAVLWLLVFLGFLALVLRMHMSGVVASVRATEDKEAARILADAGLSLATALVRAGPEDGIGALPDIVRGDAETATGRVSVTVANEALRIDVNTGLPPLIEGVLISAGMDQRTASRTVDDIIKKRRRVVATTPQAGSGPQQAKGEPLQSVSELMASENLPEPIAIEVERMLTVSSGLEGVRLHLLEDNLLRSIPDMPESALAAIRAHRNGKMTFEQMQAILTPLPFYTTEQAISWRVQLTATLPSGYSERYEAVVIISPEDDAPYRVLDWRRS